MEEHCNASKSRACICDHVDLPLVFARINQFDEGFEWVVQQPHLIQPEYFQRIEFCVEGGHQLRQRWDGVEDKRWLDVAHSNFISVWSSTLLWFVKKFAENVKDPDELIEPESIPERLVFLQFWPQNEERWGYHVEPKPETDKTMPDWFYNHRSAYFVVYYHGFFVIIDN